VLLAANAFAAKEGPDEQQQASDDGAPKGQQADAWALLRAEQERLLREQQPEVFHLWPEHEPALHLFRAVETQFRLMEGLPTGLDYGAVRAHPAFRAIPREQREQVLSDISTMEPAWIGERVRVHVERMKERKAFTDSDHG
jgi:hypothetical protein